MVFCFIRQNSQIWFFHFGISAFSAIFVLFSFLLCPKPSLNFVKWKWQKKGENVWKGNPWVLLSDKARKGEAGTPVLHIKILGFNRHKRWSFKEDPKYRVRVSASKKIHFGFFFPFQNSKIYGLLFFWERKYKGVFFSTGRETEKWSQAGCGLSGAAARALNIVGSLGNTSLVPKLESLWDASSGHAYAF